MCYFAELIVWLSKRATGEGQIDENALGLYFKTGLPTFFVDLSFENTSMFICEVLH
jgi:hypothetical protein